jgi:hypothetical protein
MASGMRGGPGRARVGHRRRIRRDDQEGCTKAPPMIDPAQRTCLKCGELFLSSWVGHRRCNKCQWANQYFKHEGYRDGF